MIRLLLLLCAAIFVTLQIAGEDRGQMRFGLLEAQVEAKIAQSETLPAPVDEPLTRQSDAAPILPEAAPAAVPVVFTPVTRLITPVPEPKPVEQVETVSSPEDLGETRYVSGRSVNVRSGPSKDDAVIGKLTRGEPVKVVWIEDNGWARIRVEGDGIDGFMSVDFLTDIAP